MVIFQDFLKQIYRINDFYEFFNKKLAKISTYSLEKNRLCGKITYYG